MASFSFDSLSLSKILVIARHRRYLTVSVISWVTMFLLLILVISPQLTAIFILRSNLGGKETKLASLQATTQALSNVDTASLEENIRILQTALPSQKPVLPLLFTLNRLATRSQVSVANFEINPGALSTKSAGIDTLEVRSPLANRVFALPLQMQVEGTFPNLNTFFQRMDEIVPLVHVKSITFTLPDQHQAASAGAEFIAEVKLDTLYAKINTPSQVTDEVTEVPLASQQYLEKLRGFYQAYQADVQEQANQSATSSARKNLFSF